MRIITLIRSHTFPEGLRQLHTTTPYVQHKAHTRIHAFKQVSGLRVKFSTSDGPMPSVYLDTGGTEEAERFIPQLQGGHVTDEDGLCYIDNSINRTIDQGLYGSCCDHIDLHTRFPLIAFMHVRV